MTDEEFFATFPDRQAHIRPPVNELVIDKQRRASYQQECDAQFRTLGEHEYNRRRILLWRVPKDNPHFNPRRPQIIKIPFLLFSDETVDDRDDVLLPILFEIMQQEREKQVWH